MTRHHDRQIGHEPPRAVFGHDGDLRWDGKIHVFDISGHFLRFGEELAKGPGLDIVDIAAHGLGKKDLVGVFGAIVEDVVRHCFAILPLGDTSFRHGESGCDGLIRAGLLFEACWGWLRCSNVEIVSFVDLWEWRWRKK